MKKLFVVVLVLACSVGLWSTGQTEKTAKQVTLKIFTGNPEYAAIEKGLWALYSEEHPAVKFQIVAVNEDGMAAFLARVASGDVPDISVGTDPTPNKDNYKMYYDLKKIDYPYWDKLPAYAGKDAWKSVFGIDYTPCLIWRAGGYFSFVYRKDMMDKTGMDPRATVRSFKDLEAFLEKLNSYAANTPEISYGWDFSWESWVFGLHFMPMLANALGGDLNKQTDVYKGKIKWTDKNDPFLPAFNLLKEYTEKGYIPAKWWTREWENDMEKSFMSRKSMMVFHGPWIWNKVAASDPNAKLTGFPLPTKNGKIVGMNNGIVGAAIFTGAEKRSYFNVTKDAFIWAFSPKMLKLRGQAYGHDVTMDLSSVGGIKLKGAQYLQIAKPIKEGYFGKVSMDFTLHPFSRVGSYKVSGKPNVLMDDSVAQITANYITNKTTLNSLASTLEKRWKNAYDFTK